jgi:hypothetical protein
MSVTGAPQAQNLFGRVQNILLRPKAEWGVIAEEPASVQGLMLGYAAILAALPALAQIVSGFMPHCVVFGVGICVTWNPVWIVTGAVVSYIVSLVGVFVTGLAIDALAPSFGGEKNQVQAMKVAVYSWTAAWLAGVFVIVPWFGLLLGLLGLYSVYLLYAGLTPLMKSPPDKTVGYTAVVVVLAFVIFLVVGAIASSVAAVGAIGGGVLGPTASMGGTVSVNGSNVDLGKLQSAAKQVESQFRQNGAGGSQAKITPIDPEKLKALLPDNLDGAPRTDVSVTSGSAAGFGGSNAEATYQKGDVRVTLTVTDLAAAGGFAAMAGAINVQSDRETSSGYEKVSTVGGRLTTERYDNQSKSGEFSVIVGNRFHISAEGSGVGMDVLKGAVAAVGPDRLEGLAHG